MILNWHPHGQGTIEKNLDSRSKRNEETKPSRTPVKGWRELDVGIWEVLR